MFRKKEEVLQEVFDKHGQDAIYITNTGYLSRDIYAQFSENKNIFYMQGSMGLSPAIALGLAKNTDKDVVAFIGDGSLLMHLGITHTIRDENLNNLFVYVVDNQSHESVGAYPCSLLESSYPGIDKIYKVERDVKNSRVGISFEENTRNIIEFIKNV